MEGLDYTFPLIYSLAFQIAFTFGDCWVSICFADLWSPEQAWQMIQRFLSGLNVVLYFNWVGDDVQTMVCLQSWYLKWLVFFILFSFYCLSRRMRKKLVNSVGEKWSLSKHWKTNGTSKACYKVMRPFDRHFHFCSVKETCKRHTTSVIIRKLLKKNAENQSYFSST